MRMHRCREVSGRGRLPSPTQSTPRPQPLDVSTSVDTEPNSAPHAHRCALVPGSRILRYSRMPAGNRSHIPTSTHQLLGTRTNITKHSSTCIHTSLPKTPHYANRLCRPVPHEHPSASNPPIPTRKTRVRLAHPRTHPSGTPSVPLGTEGNQQTHPTNISNKHLLLA